MMYFFLCGIIIRIFQLSMDKHLVLFWIFHLVIDPYLVYLIYYMERGTPFIAVPRSFELLITVFQIILL